MINPILESISTFYLLFWMAVFVLFVVDWSFGYDRIVAALDGMFEKIEDFVPIEATYPPIMLTVIGALCLGLSVPFGTLFFGNMGIMFGAMGVCYIILLAFVTVARLLLLNVRTYFIVRRAEKANAKKSLTDSE